MSTAGQRFLIDASMVTGGGGFTYVVNVLPHLLRLAPNDRFHVLLRSERLEASLPEAPHLELTRLGPVGPIGRLVHLATVAPRIAKSWDADLYFSVAESAPPRISCPSIASFRNAAVVLRKGFHWQLPRTIRLRLLYSLSGVAARRCDKILFVSHDSARWMGDDFSLPPAKRTVIHHGIDLGAWQQTQEERVHERPYILSVSSIYRYKNFVRLIEAYTQLANRIPDPPDLVIVGDDEDPPYTAQMQAARLAAGEYAERIHIIGEVPYAKVHQYYAGALLFVFASYLETFGHPLLEAMASGVPLIAADLPVFREIAEDAALYADPYRTESLSEAMEQVLTLPQVKSDLRKRGGERVREFSWARSSEQLLELLRSTARPAG